MRAIIIRTVVAGSLLTVAGPALAQGLAREIEQQIEESAREFARQIEAQMRDLTALAVQRGRPQPPEPPQPRPQRRGQRGPEETERITRTVRLGPTGILDVNNLSGNVNVTGGSGNDVVIEAVKRTFGPRAQLQYVEIEVRELSNRVQVVTRHPEGREDRDANVSVDYTISVPQGARLFISTLSGNIRTTNVRGEVRAETLSGNIQSTGATGIGLLKTVSGNVSLMDVQSDEAITASSLSGNLTVQNVRARSVSLVSVSGNLRLTEIDCEQAMVRSTNGDITYIGSLRRGGRYEITTFNGDLTMGITANGFDLEASTSNGDIRSDFPVTLGSTPGDGRRGRGAGDAIRGTFGDGGAVLVLRSFNGDITLARR